jgi:hypothetical protein
MSTLLGEVIEKTSELLSELSPVALAAFRDGMLVVLINMLFVIGNARD